MSKTMQIAQQAKQASINFLKYNEKQRNSALINIAKNITARSKEILKANTEDLENAKKLNLPTALIDRLTLNPDRIQGMTEGVQSIAEQEQVVGKIVYESTRPNGLIIQKQQIPLGVIGMIFESRPNVVVDCAALAIKSGNAIILKGGKEAKNSNQILAKIVRDSIQDLIPADTVQLIEDREQVEELLKLNDYIDVMIPRGGEKLIQFVYDNAKMPVIAHFKGLCHGYIHSDADLEKAKNICINAKTQRPGVCNAMETLLLNKELPDDFIKDLLESFDQLNTELRLGPELSQKFPKYKSATQDDWSTEYLDNILSIKQVNNLNEAIEHIQKYGTHHTEFICTSSDEIAQEFQHQIDASCIMINASSRFNDGGQLGLGAEIGISTSKIHAYGPMGAQELTTSRFVVKGQGQTRDS